MAAPTISGDMKRRGAFEMRDDLTYNISETVPVQSQKKLHGLNRVNTSTNIEPYYMQRYFIADVRCCTCKPDCTVSEISMYKRPEGANVSVLI